MGKVIDIRSNQPHMQGPAICLSCKATWRAVAEVGTQVLECPVCYLDKGVFSTLTVPDHLWQCNCGCTHFFMTVNGASCCLCGVTQVF